MAKTKLNLPAILDREIPDLAIPEPISSSGFMRRTHVECISAKDTEEELTVGLVYRVEDLTEDDGILVHNDNGNVQPYHNWHFKDIEHGPFKEGDEVQILGSDDSQIVEKPREGHYNIPDYVGGKYIVYSGNDTESILQIKPGVKFKFPNRELKYNKRYKMLNKNPLSKGDKVKCIKDNKALILGCLYSIEAIDGDYVYLKEEAGSGNRYRYNIFMKWDRPSRLQLKVKKYKTKMNLADHVRYYVNRKSGQKLTDIRKQMLEDKVIGDDISLHDLKKICDTMFTWK